MKVAIWDTYVKSKNGYVLHFDIIVPEELKDPETIYGYGKNYLSTLGEPTQELDTEKCQFCHIEEPSEELMDVIRQEGYYILEMDNIPAHLPESPSRKDLIMHVRAHFPQYRFANFTGIPDEEIISLIK